MMVQTAVSAHARNLRENHDLARAADKLSQQLSPWGGVLARIHDCREGGRQKFPNMPVHCDYEVRSLSKELRLLAAEAGFTGASHALWRRWNEDIVLAVVIPRFKNPRLLMDFMTAMNSGASQWRVEHIGARLFRSLFPSPPRARDIFLSRTLRDTLPIVHVSARISRLTTT